MDREGAVAPRRAPPGLNSRTAAEHNGEADMEVLRNIENVYFSDPKEFDATRYVLDRIPANADCSILEDMFARLKRQQQVVSGKALYLISQQRDACDKQTQEIDAVSELLRDAYATCRSARDNLSAANGRLTVSTFVILANFRKRQIVRSILRILELLRVLMHSEEAVQSLLKSEDYEGAVRLLYRCRRVAVAHKEFACMASLSSRLQDTLELTEEQLDLVLARVCKEFNPDVFAKLRRAYALLDKLQMAMDQLHMHYSSAVLESALVTVRSYVPNSNETTLKALCIAVPTSQAPSCLLDLCDGLWSVMRSYYKMVGWHSEHDDEPLPSHDNAPTKTEFETERNKEYVRRKLKNGLLRVWQDVQSKVSTFLNQSGLEEYSFEKFVLVLGILRRLMQIAEEFCGDTSDGLQTFIKDNSIAYLRNYHKGRMDELKLYMENEGWEPCPVKSGFNCLHLQEFKPFKHLVKNSVSPVKKNNVGGSDLHSDGASSIYSQDDSVYILKCFRSHKRGLSPFNIFRCDNVTQEDIFGVENDSVRNFDDSEESEPDDVVRDDIMDLSADKYASLSDTKSVAGVVSEVRDDRHVAPLVTNTTLSILRHCGQYLQMCRYLRPIALEIIMLVSQMFDYYLYSVHLFFASDLEVASSTLYSAKLNSLLRKVGNNLTSDDAGDGESEVQTGRSFYVGKPQWSSVVDLTSVESLHGLAERLVGVESGVFLARQLKLLQPYLESLVAPHQRVVLETFCEQTEAAATDARLPVYMCCASRVLDARDALVSMSQVNWEVRNVATDHSAYVNQIVRCVQLFAMRFDRIVRAVPVTSDVRRTVWTVVAKYVIHVLVEGFSNANRCSSAGRGLMQLDYTQLLTKLSKISSLKPVPHQEYVENYVKAYYLDRDSLEKFVIEHLEYSNKHLLALVNCSCDSKKAKQELSLVLENRATNIY